VLIVFFSSRISPRTSTYLAGKSPVRYRRGDLLLRLIVRLLAIELTDSVNSFHVPATPRTCAWLPVFLPYLLRAPRGHFRCERIELIPIVLIVFFNSKISRARPP